MTTHAHSLRNFVIVVSKRTPRFWRCCIILHSRHTCTYIVYRSSRATIDAAVQLVRRTLGLEEKIIHGWFHVTNTSHDACLQQVPRFPSTSYSYKCMHIYTKTQKKYTRQSARYTAVNQQHKEGVLHHYHLRGTCSVV